MAKELTLTEKLAKVKATIKEIKTDPARGVGVVSVEISYDGTVWHKPFAISLKNKIDFEEFKTKLQEEVRKDFDKDSALAELSAKEGKPFNLFENEKIS